MILETVSFSQIPFATILDLFKYVHLTSPHNCLAMITNEKNNVHIEVVALPKTKGL